MIMAGFCRVCGYELEAPPWGESGEHPTYGYCPSCNTQFGVTDTDDEQIRAERKAWVNAGLPWRSKRWPQPDDWNPVEQIHFIPYIFVDLGKEPYLAALLSNSGEDDE